MQIPISTASRPNRKWDQSVRVQKSLPKSGHKSYKHKMEENQLDWGPVIRWFGNVPLFHDAEVLSVELHRDPIPSIVRVHAFRMNSDTDKRGYYRLDLHALVTFSLSGIERVELEDWNYQNALQSLEIKKLDDAYQLDMSGAYGVHGLIAAKSIAIQVEPWQPDLPVK